jgi:multidrug efflux system membrane fusion protein
MSPSEIPMPSPDLTQPTPDREALRDPPIRWLRPAAIVGIVVVVLVVAVGLIGRALASRDLGAWTAEAAIPTVSVIRASGAQGAQPLVLPSQVQAYFDSPIHARVSGYLKGWYDDIGAHVKAGQLLALIDTPDLDQQLEQAKADLATAQANQQLAKVTADRWNNLLAQDAVSKQDTADKNGDLAAKTALARAAKANVDRLDALESFKRITAPFDGVVTARTTDIGDLITVGAVGDPGLFTVADTHRMRIYVSVPQAYAAQVHAGQVVQVTVPEYPGRIFNATLTSTSGAIGAQSGALTAELQIDNADGALKPGDYAQVTFDLPGQAGAMRLPASALIFKHDGMNVAVVGPGDHVILKHVIVGQDLGTDVELSAGIAPGDRVIDNPPDSIAAGELVRIAAPAPAGQPQE